MGQKCSSHCRQYVIDKASDEVVHDIVAVVADCDASLAAPTQSCRVPDDSQKNVVMVLEHGILRGDFIAQENSSSSDTCKCEQLGRIEHQEAEPDVESSIASQAAVSETSDVEVKNITAKTSAENHICLDAVAKTPSGTSIGLGSSLDESGLDKFAADGSGQGTRKLTPKAKAKAPLKKKTPRVVRVLFLRHAQQENSFLDLRDPPLSELGVEQARSWRDTIGDLGAQLVLVSPLRRALQTACLAFGAAGVPMKACRHAREMCWDINQNKFSAASDLSRFMSSLTCGSSVENIAEAVRSSADDPVDEKASVARLKQLIPQFGVKVIGVVCHWGVVNEICGRSAGHAEIVECELKSGIFHVVQHHACPHMQALQENPSAGPGHRR